MNGVEGPCRAFLGVAGLVALLTAGLVLASSWFVSYPGSVLLAAWLLASVGLVAVMLDAFRQTRATNTDFVAAVGQCFKALRQFVLAFF